MYQKNKPIVTIKHQSADKIIDALGYAAILALFAIPFAFYADLPQEIPYHYDLSGAPNAFGGRNAIWVLPLVATIIVIGISLLSRIPSVFNYPVTITNQNAAKQYALAIRFMGLLKVLIGWYFCLINYQSIQIALNNSNVLNGFSLFLFLALLLALIIGYFIKAFRLK
ncbi:MAG: hypothetical protein CVU09_17450 [Bacteroidetes bacterium HGW-Bacteroidetes-4]|jgi:uncharacterized membrane protein|nr:MAG: hypothetical protein CVU09_17450 [Bacteroidetes bacterium HGW-Bacteroidetes-4]